MHKRGLSRFSVEIFLSHSTGKIRRGTFRCFRENRASKNFVHKRRGGYHDSPSKLFLHSTKIFRRRTLPGLRKMLVSDFFMYKRGFSVVIFRLKIKSKVWDSNPDLPLQNLFVPPTVPSGPLEWSF